LVVEVFFASLQVVLVSSVRQRLCRQPSSVFVIIWLFIHAALISAVFIRLLSALLVAPRNFAPRSFVSLHCSMLRRPPARKAGSMRFVRNRIALPVEAKRAIPFLQKRNAKT
jgi:hypothetical protein